MPRFYLLLALYVWTISLDQVQAWISPCRTRRLQRRPFSRTAASAAANDVSSELLLYNSLTRSKEPLRPITPGHISMYTCGPTVYDFAHVGNFRAFLTYDLLKRVLLYLGLDVTHVCNLTDVDDKIINRANEQELPDITALTRKYEELFFDDLKALNIVPATVYPRATEHIDDMMDMIRTLAKKGLAYETPDGSWYFDTQRQEGYGQQLVQLNYDEMESTDRGDAIDKRHFADFCLWKAFKPGVDRLDSAWEAADIKLGRPGWHLECSAMALKYFGDTTIDLHGGGVDLKFPHHENEIAQSQGVLEKRFCNCWFHNGFVNLDNEKMSKSLGNFLTLRTACPKADDVRAYRYLVVSSHYRNPLAFTPEAMKAAKNAIRRIDKVKAQIEIAVAAEDANQEVGSSDLVDSVVPSILANFEAAILDDLTMPRAAASLFSLVKAAEGEFKRVAKQPDAASLDVAGLRAILNAMNDMDRVFGIFYQVPDSASDQKADDEKDDFLIPSDVLDLVSQRTAAKQAKDWELADSLRARIMELGFTVKDVKGGDPIVSKVVN